MESESRDHLSPTKSSFNLATSPEDAETPISNGSGETTPAGPFNFDTAVMAKSPVVKSVSAIAIDTVARYSSNKYFSIAEYRTTSWPQVQAQ
jgi:hypothetical protein